MSLCLLANSYSSKTLNGQKDIAKDTWEKGVAKSETEKGKQNELEITFCPFSMSSRYSPRILISSTYTHTSITLSATYVSKLCACEEIRFVSFFYSWFLGPSNWLGIGRESRIELADAPNKFMILSSVYGFNVILHRKYKPIKLQHGNES